MTKVEIRKMAGEAGIKCYGDVRLPPEAIDRFAELLIKACATQVARNLKINWLEAAQAAKDLKEHFGIKE